MSGEVQALRTQLLALQNEAQELRRAVEEAVSAAARIVSARRTS